MGYFSDIVSSARANAARTPCTPVSGPGPVISDTVPKTGTVTPSPVPVPGPEHGRAAIEPAVHEPAVHEPAVHEPAAHEPAAPASIPDTVPKPKAAIPSPGPVPGPETAAPAPAPAIDLSHDADDAAARAAHERAEAERRAAFDKAQAEKRAAAQAGLDRIAAMPDAEAQTAAAGQIAAELERITRRGMKEAVAAHLTGRVRSDPAFAKAALRPGKTLQAAFKRINEKAREYLKQEAEAAGEAVSGAYGGDVPDDLVYRWAAEFMLEDPEEPSEKFVPRPYTPPRRSNKPGKARKPEPAGKPAKEAPKAQEKPPAAPSMEQLSLM